MRKSVQMFWRIEMQTFKRTWVDLFTGADTKCPMARDSMPVSVQTVRFKDASFLAFALQLCGDRRMLISNPKEDHGAT